MVNKTESRFRSGMQTSPWIILGSTIILLAVVMVLTYQNTNRQKHYMSEILREKGAAFIRAVEAGARSGMMGMAWDGQAMQRLLEETGRLPDVRYIAVINDHGRVVAHSDPSEMGKLFDNGRKVVHLGPDQMENWELITRSNHDRIFEVHRHFRPMRLDDPAAMAPMQSMMRHHGMGERNSNGWFLPENYRKLMIIVGLDVSPFEEAVESDIETTVVLSTVMLLLGFGGFVSLFWMYSYRTAKKSLEDTSAFANEVVGHLPVGLIATDQQDRITFFNHSAEKITGLSRTLVQNELFSDFLPDALMDMHAHLDHGKVISDQEMRLDFKAHGIVPVSISASRIINDIGEFVGKVFIIRDLSEIRRLQEEIRQQEKLATVGSIAAGVAHEVRNPLSSIKALATFFAGRFTDDREAGEAADVLLQEVDRLNRVITELLDFARPSDVNRKNEDIGLLLSNSIRLIQQDAVNRNIHIQLEVEEPICPAWIDADRLSQCLLNLYINAIQAMGESGTLTVRGASVKEGQVELVVSDTGQGISPEDLKNIFDPYFTTKKKGTGLGLAVVRKIIDAHKGQIYVKSAEGQGASFTITLPCQPPQDIERKP